MTHRQTAAPLTRLLGLAAPPVAVAYIDEPPPGTPRWDGPAVPSACTFWRRAESRVFFAPAADHMNCPIGALTSGFALDAAAEENLGGVVARMAEAGYLDPAEPRRLPRVSARKSGALYGPLAVFPDRPDIVLAWIDARQAMLLKEASGDARWDRPAGLPSFGRPSCAALPVALADDRPVLSFGCAGMRTFAGLDDGLLLAVIPGRSLESVLEALERASRANRAVQAMYDEMRAAHPG